MKIAAGRLVRPAPHRSLTTRGRSIQCDRHLERVLTVQQVPPRQIMTDTTTGVDCGPDTTATIGEADRMRISQLTCQQKRVFALLSQGLSNKEIARMLGLHESTVKVHVSAILARLSCRNRTTAALLSLRYQLSQIYREARRIRTATEPTHAPVFQQPTRVS